MARIPTYQKDIHISDLDRIIGTDGDTNELVTKNFFLGDIAEYVIDKFIDPDAVSFTIPVFRDTQDTLGSNATRITGSIMSQDVNPDGTKITIAGLLQVDKEAKIKGKLTEGVAESGRLILNSSLNATGITIKAPAHADLPASYTMELPNDIGTAGRHLTTDGVGKVYWADPEEVEFAITLRQPARFLVPVQPGDPVYITGYNVGQERYEVGLAQAGDPARMPAIGVAADAYGANDNGYIITHGAAKGINTNAFNVGDTVWVAYSGGLTNTRPIGTTLVQNVGIVGKKSGGAGEIEAIALGRTNDVPNIPRGSMWVGDAAGVAKPLPLGTSGQILVSDGTDVNWAGGNVIKKAGTGTTQTLPVWLNGHMGILGDSPIKVVQSASTPSPTYDENILIGSTLDLAVESKRTLQIGDDNIIGSLLGKTKNSLLVGQENSIIASATKPEIINSAVVGLQNEVTANNSLVAGRENVVQSDVSFVTGSSNVTSSAPRQFVIGRQNTVDSEDAAVLGDENTVTTITTGHKGAMVFGNLNNVLGDRVFCLGTSNTVASDNQNAFIIGKGNTSTANNSYSIGLQNSISGNDSYALGKLNTSASPSSVAIGIDNEINGEKAYAFGNNNSNIGIESFAIGRKNNGITNDGVSAARETYLIGFENKLVTDNTIILGRFSDTTVLSTDSTEERSTIAFAVGASDSKRRTAWEFRGRSKNFGNTKAGDSMRIMAHALRYSTSYVNDADAGNGGVEMGQLYRNGSDVKIRMDGNEPSGATYLVPFNVTASPGGSSTLSAVDVATLVKISWSGANGTYTLNLPPAADMQYRKVRFISDGTFGTGAGDKVLITPNGTETVDGASDFEISKSYEGVALWSDGTEWIIIQAKAH